MVVGPDEELPRVTIGLLRRADAMCPRLLHHEHFSGRKLSKLCDAGFAVTNRVVEDAITWHEGGRAGDSARDAFPEPTDLEPEQRAYYDALARGYLALFPRTDATVADLDWSTDLPELGVRLVGRIGIALEAGDDRELRVLRGGRRLTFDRADTAFTVLRAAQWAPGPLRIVAFDPLTLDIDPTEVNVADHYDDMYAWVAERVATIRARADRLVAVAGSECRHCSCIPGCPKLMASAS